MRKIRKRLKNPKSQSDLSMSRSEYPRQAEKTQHKFHDVHKLYQVIHSLSYNLYTVLCLWEDLTVTRDLEESGTKKNPAFPKSKGKKAKLCTKSPILQAGRCGWVKLPAGVGLHLPQYWVMGKSWGNGDIQEAGAPRPQGVVASGRGRCKEKASLLEAGMLKISRRGEG